MTKYHGLAAQVGGICYLFLCFVCTYWIYLSLSGALIQSSGAVVKQASAPNEPLIFALVIMFFLGGLVGYRLVALRNGIHLSWVWWLIFLSALLMISAGALSGRIVLIVLGISHLLHCYGTKELLSKTAK
jgi:hypothetical protein